MLLLLVGAPLLIAATSPDPVFDKRFNSFIDAGYDALTAPPEWFDPTERVAGGGDTSIPVAAPSTKAIASTALAAAASYAEAQGSTALIVMRDGAVEYEHYWRDNGPDSVFNPQSMSKTVLALLVGAAIADGKIRSVDDPVERYVPEWRGDPRGKITIENLLNMASGLAQLEEGFGYELTPENPAARQHFGSDFHAPILTLRAKVPPGQTFDYNNNGSNLLGLIVERATGERYADYLSRKLWAPLGLRDAHLYLDKPEGHPITACCILSHPRDWAKIGQLILQNGKWEGREIVPASWIAAMIKPSAPYKGYGYQIWLGDQKVEAERPSHLAPDDSWQSEPFAAPDIIALRGHGFQRVWIIPSKKLVIMRAGKSWPPSWNEALIPNILIRGMK
ncbi:serine hydrolase domain-containing protein [Sphingopyxis lindanitolerans]|uniref:serine hydrolase domain-containing protein n=1 Tax=Sphingopyxis lindanitolerans TaxID=2054227 RepID=UPI001304D8E4|nr:serine hydrolase [Sphingopyxis lindanitolerans]